MLVQNTGGPQTLTALSKVAARPASFLRANGSEGFHFLGIRNGAASCSSLRLRTGDFRGSPQLLAAVAPEHKARDRERLQIGRFVWTMSGAEVAPLRRTNVGI
jgi:hypothetical protein